MVRFTFCCQCFHTSDRYCISKTNALLLHGIPVYIVRSEYILLRSNEVDLELFLEEITTKECNTLSPQLTKDFVGSLLKNMDSAWDRKILKVALGATHTRQQLTDIGISSRIENYTQSVLQAIEKKNGVDSEARCQVTKNLTRRAFLKG